MSTGTSPRDVRIKVNYDNNNINFLNLNQPCTGNDAIFLEPPDPPQFPLPPNIKDNPWVANANTGAQLSIPERDPILPRPWRKVKHLIIVTLVATLMCCCLSAIANKFAWRAKNLKLLHRYDEAKYYAKRSVILFYISIVVGVIMIAVVVSAIVVKFFNDGKIVID